MKKLLFLALISIGINVSAQNNYSFYSPSGTYGSVFVSIVSSPDYQCISWHDTMKTVLLTDTTQIVGKLMLSGNSNQYVKGNGDFATFPTQVTSTSQLVNNSGFITSEVDGSVTNEIELPSQTGNAGKVLSTTGTVTTWTTPTVTVSAPSFNNSITSGTAFQPNANSASAIVVSSSLTGSLVGVYGTSIISISSTQSGTYTNIGSGMSFFLNVLAVGDNRDSGTILVPKGYWVKVTNSTTGLGGALTSTYTRWDF